MAILQISKLKFKQQVMHRDAESHTMVCLLPKAAFH